MVLNFDARTLPSDLSQPSPARFTLSAHDGAVSALDVNPHIRGCLLTGGTDKLVKIWNIVDNGKKRDVTLVTSRDLGVVSWPLGLFHMYGIWSADKTPFRERCSAHRGHPMIRSP